ncbi:probable xyloglucan endotransglucosylase/hydrolase protein 33 isoform X2 [Gossypium arboreum]|uniref:probable xyloglucan endotransglucosylase/hydrolase protein 33 isoform X2 n=1 Tax=Gossypium arboreum TaxID=29729 RepID=UPI0008195334|nr:probable xyloglucan endotransglucosylase/hydrolase protein 33 isoform X2 [Gossypium arboreum]
MAIFQHIILLLCLSLFCATSLVSSHNRHYTSPSVPRLTDLFSHVSVNKSFSNVFGGPNIKILNNGSTATFALDRTSGSGLASWNKYNYGFFSAAIKLPAGLTSGVVVAFYLSNADMYPHSHDEIDIELLGNDKRIDWVLQTNVYANGVSTGREEKFYFWFNPTLQHHYYSILWNSHHIVFLVDNIPVREFPNNGKFSAAYPSKPMSLYVTIWDGSQWATHGGKYPVNYNASVSSIDPVEGPDFFKLSNQQMSAMVWARRKLMFYSYCKDTSRFKVLLPECK